MTSHTPGPWTLGQNGDNCARNHAICDGPYVIAKVYGNGYPIGAGWSPETEANARLIAAAPDMLAALQFARKRLLETQESSEPQIDAAIAKAEGTTP